MSIRLINSESNDNSLYCIANGSVGITAYTEEEMTKVEKREDEARHCLPAIEGDKTMSEWRQTRDSFNRFGDDLCGDLLRHVSLSDCFAFECVSKRFKRSVFNGQIKLDTDDGDFYCLSIKLRDKCNSTKYTRINEILFECALKKCLFINDITVGYNYDSNDRIIDIIRENCSQLTSFKIKPILSNDMVISPKTWQLFGEKFGNSLRRISFNKDEKSLQTLLRFTTNLIECERISLNDFIFETHERQHVLPKLKKITAICDDDSDFQSFADIYCDRVETIILFLFKNLLSIDRIRVMFEQLSRFRYLEVLHIPSYLVQDYKYIDKAFDLIAENCGKLRSLSLHSNSTIFRRIRHRFESLTRLTLVCNFIEFSDVVHLNVNDLRCCPNLTQLRIQFLWIRHNSYHFTDIHLHLPKLQCFELSCESVVTNQLLESLALLKDLYYIKVFVRNGSVTDTELRNFIKLCQSIRKMDFKSVSSLSRQTIDEFVSHAKRGSKQYNYRLRVKALKVEIEMQDISDNLPKNISIDIKREIFYR